LTAGWQILVIPFDIRTCAQFASKIGFVRKKNVSANVRVPRRIGFEMTLRANWVRSAFFFISRKWPEHKDASLFAGMCCPLNVLRFCPTITLLYSTLAYSNVCFALSQH
jgi:hypothetical protein